MQNIINFLLKDYCPVRRKLGQAFNQNSECCATMLVSLVSAFCFCPLLTCGAFLLPTQQQSTRGHFVSARYSTSSDESVLPSLTSLRKLCDDFDCFVLDGYGTLHDGFRALPGAREALYRLQEQGKRIILVSNSLFDRQEEARQWENMGLSGAIISDFDYGIIVPGVPMISLFTVGHLLRQLFDDMNSSCEEVPGNPRSLGCSPFFIAPKTSSDSIPNRASAIEEATCIVVDPIYFYFEISNVEMSKHLSSWALLDIAAEKQIPMILVYKRYSSPFYLSM